MKKTGKEWSRGLGEAAEDLSLACLDHIIIPCISEALWSVWHLQRISEWRRNPSRVMVMLYALRAAIFNPYPSCFSNKLCNHGPVTGNRQVPLSHGVFMLYLKKIQWFYFRCASPLYFCISLFINFFNLMWYVRPLTYFSSFFMSFPCFFTSLTVSFSLPLGVLSLAYSLLSKHSLLTDFS